MSTGEFRRQIMIIFVLAGFAALIAIAILVAITDAAETSAKRLRAAERRELWEKQHARRETCTGEPDERHDHTR
jgi:hypothetical protein